MPSASKRMIINVIIAGLAFDFFFSALAFFAASFLACFSSFFFIFAASFSEAILCASAILAAFLSSAAFLAASFSAIFFSCSAYPFCRAGCRRAGARRSSRCAFPSGPRWGVFFPLCIFACGPARRRRAHPSLGRRPGQAAGAFRKTQA